SSARAPLLANADIQCGGSLPASVSYGGDGVPGLDDLSGIAQQALVMTVEAQITVAVIEDHQQPGAAQPVGEYHPSAVYGAHLGAQVGADQYPVPLGSSVAAARSAVACDQTSVDGPGQFPLGVGERPAEVAAGAGNKRAGRRIAACPA